MRSQRCLAVSVAVAIGDAQKTFAILLPSQRRNFASATASMKGADGPGYHAAKAKQRIEKLIGEGEQSGAKVPSRRSQRKDPELRIWQFRKATVS